MTHYLICDLNIQKKGHYIGYNQYIINDIAKLKGSTDRKYSFLYNEEAKHFLSFPDILKEDVHFLDDNCWSNISMKEKISLFKKAVTIANELHADHLIFMDLDQYQFPIFRTAFSFKLSGVLFRPHHRIMHSSDTFKSKLASRIQRIKKIIAEKFLISKKNVENVFILNDEEGVKFLNKFHNTNQFKFLQDPIFSYPSSLKSYEEDGVVKFLIFGSMNERKNITTIVKAFAATNFTTKAELLIVGHAEQSYLTYLHELVSNLPGIHADKKITIKSGFVTDEEMDNYFHSATVCLLIYKDFYGSSGLLGRAALHNKKVIGANVGLLKELIEKNSLGITCDPKSETEISKALIEILDKDFPSENFQRFFETYSPETFFKTLLQLRI
ncbi:MAG: glycosyltransferase [Cytophaga sp.]|uniref:glycosyltransferase n=1 Tax=Cytophaga sp. TaxID=29535 RepID=UPI003F7D4E5F